jgi:membrane protease YdiL (CAAX protease family)
VDSQDRFRTWVRSHALAAYFTLVLALTWAWWIPLAVGGSIVRPGASATHVPGLLGPMLAAFAVTALAYGRAGVRDLLSRMCRLRIGLGWFVFSMASPVVVYLLATVAMRVAGGVWPNWSDLGRFGGLPDLGVPVAWLLLVLIDGFGEEVGWRGFAYPRLRQNRSLLRSALILAVPWAIWHLPSFFFLETYRQLGATILPGFFLGLAAGSIVFAWLYEKTHGSILAVALWHGSYNLVSATVAARGVPAAVVSTAVMVWAVVIAAGELRRRRPSPV